MSVLDKPAVDTDIEHLDFPASSIPCYLKDPNHSESGEATHRWVLSCGHGGLVCEKHARLIEDIRRQTLDGAGWCTQGDGKQHVAYIVTLEPIK